MNIIISNRNINRNRYNFGKRWRNVRGPLILIILDGLRMNLDNLNCVGDNR